MERLTDITIECVISFLVIGVVLGLLKWTGGKKEDEDVDEAAREAVQETVVNFIKTLLGSKR